jgi:hypothetical protein
MSYSAGLVKIPPAMLAGAFVPNAYVAVRVKVSPLGSVKYDCKGIRRELVYAQLTAGIVGLICGA